MSIRRFSVLLMVIVFICMNTVLCGEPILFPDTQLVMSTEYITAILLDKYQPSGARSEAAYKLGELKDPRAVEALIKALSFPETTIAANAAWALGMIGDPRSIESLIRQVENGKPEIRIAIVDSLSNFKEQNAFNTILAISQTETDTAVFCQIIKSLSRYENKETWVCS